ncbi:MAG: MmcQ/YjbR family DNA-binding protein [Alphaproteobacteria bacterium]
MRYEDIKKHCLSLPGAMLSIQWGNDRVFKVAGKMFAVLSPPGQKPPTLSFKTSDDSFHILTQMKHIRPAPYLARAHWVYLERLGALPKRELKEYLTRAHLLVAASLPKKAQAALIRSVSRKAERKTSARRRRR